MAEEDVNEDVIPEVENCRLALLTLSEANEVLCFTPWLPTCPALSGSLALCGRGHFLSLKAFFIE